MAALAPLSGCTTERTSRGPSFRTTTDPLLAEAQAALAPWVALARATASQFLQDPLAAHHSALAAAYRDVLADHVGRPHDLPAPTVAERIRPARRELIRSATEAHQRMSSMAGTAQQGATAWLLGSIAAGLAQGAGLPPPPVQPLGDPVGLTAADRESTSPLLARLHEGLWAAGLLGARTSASAEPALFAAVAALYDGIRAERDALVAALSAAGGNPAAALPSYPRWQQVRPTPAGLRAAAVEMCQGLTVAHAWVVYNSGGTLRAWSLDGWTRNAVRGLTFQETPETFPGASELADRVRSSPGPSNPE